MKIHSSSLLAGTLTLSLSAVSLAEESPDTPLAPVVVTATRTAQSATSALASVTVIDRAEIERRQAQSVPDLFRGLPGLSMASQGSLGKDTGMFLRGTNSDHLLVMVDGVRIGSTTTGTTPFQDIPIDQIERIEIVRGPRSSLYGSEAIGGVIQIFTRRSSGKGVRPNLSVGAGSHSTYRVGGGVSAESERAWLRLNASHLDQRGFNACSGLPFSQGGGGCFTYEPDTDGYRNTSGSARAGYRFENGLELDGTVLHTESANNYDGTISNRAKNVQQVLSGQLRYSPWDFLAMTLRAGRSIDESDNFLGRDFESAFNTQRVSTTFQNDFKLAPGHLLTVGLDYYNDQVSGTSNYAIRSRDDKAAFTQYQLNWHGFDAVLGVRVDDNEQFGVKPTGNVALGYDIASLVRLTASWGSGFKAPSFNDLYYPNYGTPNLKPESSESWEVGISGKHFGTQWSLNAYDTQIENLISPVFSMAICRPPFYFCAQNLGRAHIQGIEANAATQILGFDVAANFSLIDPMTRLAGAPNSSHLPRRAQTLFRVDIDRAIGAFRLGTTIYGEGRRFDDAANTHRLDGFVTVDLRGSISLGHGLSLEGRLANLLDEHYNTARLYRQDGRNFFVTIRYQPDGLL